MMIRTEKLSKRHAYNLYSFSNSFYKQVIVNGFDWLICVYCQKERETLSHEVVCIWASRTGRIRAFRRSRMTGYQLLYELSLSSIQKRKRVIIVKKKKRGRRAARHMSSQNLVMLLISAPISPIITIAGMMPIIMSMISCIFRSPTVHTSQLPTMRCYDDKN